jgi:saccharopine dehydrogenase-like NADP-dependent oxidoreductase
MNNIIVLGAGMVGAAMARDLAEDHSVTLTDIDAQRLEELGNAYSNLTVKQLDVTDTASLRKGIDPFDLVICAVPGFLGFRTLEAIISAGKDVVDISFFPENALELDALAREKEVTAIVDCGVAPGMGNIIVGYYDTLLELTDFECLVGGLPFEKKWPFCYKAPFSPVDVIEEYTRPARYVENGHLVVKEALSDCEYVDFEGVGTLEAFNSDGLRSLIHTMPHIPNMKEKTLRYPGHVEYVKVLKETGFFSEKPVLIGDAQVIPLEFTSKLLFNDWKLGAEDDEFTVMRITLRGKTGEGANSTIIYELFDRNCRETHISSMARTTGYTATAAANLVLQKTFTEKGVFPPERVGCHKECFDFIIEYLKERNITYSKRD